MRECMEIHPFFFITSSLAHFFSHSHPPIIPTSVHSSFSPLQTMNRYSKMTVFPKNKSRSVDFSDLSSFFHHQPSKSIPTLNSTAGERPSRLSQLEREEEEEEKCRNSPSASAVIQSAVKRALSASMRRSSSSSSERYCRIHDQPVTLWSPTEDDGGGGGRRGKMRSEKKKRTQRTARIIKACKSLLGF